MNKFMKYNDIIEKNCFDKKGNLISHCNKKQWWINKDILYVYEDIIDFTIFLSSETFMKQRLYHYINNIKDIPTCIYKDCDNKVSWHKIRYANYCSTKCASLATKSKREETSYYRYGVSNPSKNEKIKEKIKNTNIEKYGVENFSLTEEFKRDIKNGWKENKQQWLDSRKYNKEKYGYVFPFQDKKILKKAKDTFFDRYGKNCPLQVEEFLKKAKSTNIEKYGVPEYNQKNMSNIFLKNRNNKYFFEKLLEDKSLKEISKELNISYSLLCQELNKLGFDVKRYSNNEIEIFNYLCDILGNYTEIRRRSRDIISKELDLYIPQYSVAIEHNGMYWHSDIKKDQNYHFNKTNECINKGIHLIHVFENEWDEKKDIVKSILSSTFGKNEKIYARNCVVRKVSKKDEEEFLNRTHLQGYWPSKICYGLFYKNSLVQIMSFGKARFEKKYDYELLRTSSKLYTTVVGGTDKLFKNFLYDFDAKNIVSYCDIRYFKGDVYKKLGFIDSGNSSPNFYYIDNKGAMIDRYNFQKIDFEKTSEMMTNNYTDEYHRIWDCGNKVYCYYNNK